jgi:hypothetical protein
MSEKKGETGKLVYHFNTASDTKVCINDKWYRITPREFRSFDGKRSINDQEYEGPVYYFKTNKIASAPSNSGKILYDASVEYILAQKRANE